jgi:H+/gluconate symporter-like permease
MSVLAIFISLILLIVLAYRGWSVILIAPILALLAVIISSDQPILATYTQIYMKALGGYITKFLAIFLLGSIFGMLMDETGFANSIASKVLKIFGDKAIFIAVMSACAILTYGGVSLFVVAFSVYPIANNIFYTANLPKRLIPACIALGSFTFTMIALPGTPSIQNAIPMPYFGTNLYAAPMIGIVSSIAMASAGILWLHYRARVAITNGEGYGAHKFEKNTSFKSEYNIIFALSPIIVMFIANFTIDHWLISNMDTSYLKTFKYGNSDISKLRGIWSIISAMSISCVYLILISFKQLRNNLSDLLTKAVRNAFLPIFNTASEVGYGAVIATLTGFQVIKTFLTSISDDPLFNIGLSVNILSGITGSSSGGLSIALQTMGNNFLEMARIYNISPEILHRLSTISSSGLDTLPHCGAVITLLTICGLKHRDSYFDIFMVSVLFTVLTSAGVILYGYYVGF